MNRSSLVQGRLPPLRWSAIAAGAITALAGHVTLGLFASALAASAERADSSGLGFFAALFGLLVPFVATAAGAWLAVRLAGNAQPSGAHAHGLLVWALGLVAGAIFLTGSGLAAFNSRGDDVRAAESRVSSDEVAGPSSKALALAGLGALLGIAGALLGASAGRRALLASGVFRARDEFSGPPARDASDDVLPRSYDRTDVRDGPYSAH